MKKHLFSRGFVSVKLVIAIAIFGVLIFVAHNFYVDYKNDQANEAFKAEMKEVKLAIEKYKDKYGKYPNISTQEFGGGCHQHIDEAFLKSTGVVKIPNIATTIGCGYNDPVMAKMEEFISNPAVMDHKHISANSACELMYWVKNDLTNYKLIAHNCHAGADESKDGVQAEDEFAVCPRRCLSCGPSWSTYVNFSDRNNTSFYNSYAIYSDGAACS